MYENANLYASRLDPTMQKKQNTSFWVYQKAFWFSMQINVRMRLKYI